MRDLWQSGDLWGETDVWEYVYTEDIAPVQPGPEPLGANYPGRESVAYTAQKPYLGAPQEFAASASGKPYLGSPESFVGFVTAPVRHLKSIITKESAFEKPYLDLNYPKMHLNLPVPDWPSGTRYQPGDIAPIKGDLLTGNDCKYCIIVCYGDMETDQAKCDEAYGWCHISIACTKAPQIGEPNPGDVSWDIQGPVLFVEEDGMDGVDIYVDWAAVPEEDNWKTADFVATLTDGLGHICTDEFSVSCKSACLNCTITGPSTVTTSSSTQYTTDADEGCNITWSITGNATGVSVSATGLVTTTAGACGTFTLHAAVDDCSDSIVVRISDNGTWHLIDCPESDSRNSTDLCDAYCNDGVDYSICYSNPTGTCTHGSIRPCASKVDSATGLGYTDKNILCYWKGDCDYTTCDYTGYSYCTPGQTATYSYEYDWICA